jgi:Phage tail sheath C-terminal domain
MSVMILPGTYIDVLPEGLIAPGQVSIGNLGVVGTASKGALGTPTLLSSFTDALSIFGSYDSFMDPNDPTKRRANALTLVRALELAFSNGANIVYAVRVADATAAAATTILQSASGNCVELDANSPGLWGNSITATVAAPRGTDILTLTQVVTLTQAQATAKQITLDHASVASNRNRVSIRKLDGTTVSPAVVTAAPGAGQVQFTGATLVFGDTLDANSVVTAVYMVDPTLVAKVTVTLGTTKEPYLVTDGNMLVAAINDPQAGSSLVTAVAGTHADERPSAPQNLALNGGANGEANPDYSDPIMGFDSLLDVDAHIIVAAGQTATAVGAALDAHCQKASTDVYKRDRIAVVGSDFAKGNTLPLMATDITTYVDKLIGNTLASDRVVFIAPGFLAASAAAVDQPVNPVTLPGAYMAAVIAGMLAALAPHLSLTNKPVSVQGLEVKFNNAQLTELVQNRVTAVEIDRGIRVLRGQTTDVGAFREITTRRIVDYAKYGVRSAAGPYIGLLNNDRVRGALRATINSFLKGMLDDEMLVGYQLEVTATRDQQIQGIVQVTMTLQPVFSINFIHVTMILS